MLPDLSALTESKRPRSELVPDADSGVYCLNTLKTIEKCNSSILLQRSALPITAEEFEKATRFMTDRVRQDTFMGNPVPRKQCTFGPIQYKRYQLVKNVDEWPTIVTRVLEATRAFASQLGIDKPEEYSGVHANFYPDGNSSVQKHSDNEKQLIEGAPIFSYTYLFGDNPTLARDFTVWKMKSSGDVVEESTGRSKARLADITLYSGDLLVMQGEMQKYFEHSIEKQNRSVAQRLNFTVRKFVPMEEVSKRKHEGGGAASLTEGEGQT
jgi:alkylated DNA repair dioxygenase AlkB